MSNNQIDEKEIKQKKINRSKLRVNCTYTAAETINRLHYHGNVLDMDTILEELVGSGKRVLDGNTKEIELMLMMQAKALDYVFYHTLERLHDFDMINQMEAFANIAFRAQNQCRKTLLALTELKNPRRAIFIKQQNNGINQQVNNTAEKKSEKIKNSEKIANELLSEADHAALDFRGAAEAIRTNQGMEAMGVGRSEDRRRQGDKQDECV